MITSNFTDTDNLMYEIKAEDVSEDFSKYKEILMLAIFLPIFLPFVKMKDETAGVATEKFIGLNLKNVFTLSR